MNFDTAVKALALAEELDAYYTKPRETQLPPTVLEALRVYRRTRGQVPVKLGAA